VPQNFHHSSIYVDAVAERMIHTYRKGRFLVFVDSMTGLRVESYGTGTQVRLPGRTAMGKS
jgi:hypothetical protein